VSSPNEPGYPRTGDTPGSANGSVGGASGHDGGSLGNSASRSGNVADLGDAPPWQRARAARPARQQPRPSSSSPESHSRTETARGDGPAGHPPGVDARLNRFIGGGSSGAAPSHESDAPPRGERTETVRPEAYASELPDLSGPTPRTAQQRKAAPEQRASSEPVSRTTATSRIQVGTRHKGPVRASMQIRRIDPWSALKVSLVLSVALFFVWMIAVAFLYLVLGGMGVWSKLNSNVGDLLTSASGSTGGELVSSGTIFGGAALIGLVNIVLLTAMVTCGAFIYNLTTDLVGGVEVTLADRD
jgi:Transmembrane domain of unknown function (DUF3566)